MLVETLDERQSDTAGNDALIDGHIHVIPDLIAQCEEGAILAAAPIAEPVGGLQGRRVLGDNHCKELRHWLI